MKHKRKAGRILLVAALIMSQTFHLASAETKRVDVIKLFHAKQSVEKPVKQKEIDTSHVAAPIKHARLHWDAVEKTTGTSNQEKKQQEKIVELPPIQPIQTAKTAGKAGRKTASANAAEKTRMVVELPPIQRISVPVTNVPTKKSEQVVELTLQPVP